METSKKTEDGFFIRLLIKLGIVASNEESERYSRIDRELDEEEEQARMLAAKHSN